MRSEDVIARLTRRLFGSPILQNNVRGEVVEEIVASALDPEWRHCSGDWGPCDFRHSGSGLRIQVKQSAARQSWDAGEASRKNPRFLIAEKTGRYEDGGTWIAEPGRNAEIFIFAWHPIADSSADHRDPQQWLFHVVAERDLPPRKSISLPATHALAPLWTSPPSPPQSRRLRPGCTRGINEFRGHDPNQHLHSDAYGPSVGIGPTPFRRTRTEAGSILPVSTSPIIHSGSQSGPVLQLPCSSR